MNLMGYALAAAQRGFHVFPVAARGKTPGRLYPNRPESEAPWTYRWSEVATTHAPTIVGWWNQCPEYNIGIACKPSGLLVVDCDVKKYPDSFLYEYDGVKEWVTLYDHYDPKGLMQDDETYQVATGGGGCHLYYRWPQGVQASQAGISTHVDIRSNGGRKGGYVLGAGSITSKGPYMASEYWTRLLDAPPWLVELCRERPKIEQPSSNHSQSRIGQPAALSFAGLVLRVQTAAEGTRNDVLFWAARTMRDEGATEEECMNTLYQVAMDSGLRSKEAEDTIRRSAYR